MNNVKEVNVLNCICHYFEDIIKTEDLIRWKTIRKYFGLWNFMQNFGWWKTVAS